MSRPRIVALLQFRDEEMLLPGWIEAIGSRVDLVVALDDGSSDGGAELLRRSLPHLVLLRHEDNAARAWNEPENRRRIIQRAQELEPDWFVAFDADERPEDGFFSELPRLMRKAEREQILAYEFRLLELWDNAMQYRVDGIWGRKRKIAVFRNLGRAHVFDNRRWHGEWCSRTLEGTPALRFVQMNVYHLKMLRACDRTKRRRFYEAADPECRFQPIGYAYLTDERDIRLEHVPPGREYQGMP